MTDQSKRIATIASVGAVCVAIITIGGVALDAGGKRGEIEFHGRSIGAHGAQLQLHSERITRVEQRMDTEFTYIRESLHRIEQNQK